MKHIYYNGIVYTGELPLKQAFVEEGHITGTGSPMYKIGPLKM